MSQKTVPIQEALRFGWETLRNNAVFFLKLFVVLIFLSILPAIAFGKIGELGGTAMVIPMQFLNLVWQSVIGMGFLKICLKLHDSQPVEIPDLWSCLPRILDYVVVKIAVMFIVAAGLILLIIPGIIWALQFYLSSYLVIDKEAGVITALKGSSAITRGAKWELGLFATALLGLNFAGAILLGIGLMITIPLSVLATVYVYRKLLAQTEADGGWAEVVKNA
jgi:uncharacterized membrane protein